MACRHLRGEVVDRGLSLPLRDKRAGTEARLACRTRAESPEKSDDEASMAVRSRLSHKQRPIGAIEPNNLPIVRT
jgi:hypothetical protein